MQVLLKTLIIIAQIWFLLSSFNSYSQTFSIDTTTFLNPEINETGPEYFEYEPDEYEPELISNESVTRDMMFVPTDVLYNNRWDTLNIRIGRTDWSKISDSALLFMHDLREHRFVFPFKGKVISNYGPRGGRFHAGVDIKLDKGDTIVSAFDGKIRIARSIHGYGKVVVVRHLNGLETVYAHLSKYLVEVNDEVTAGQPLGLGGRTGRATTEHLHFETRILGEHFNPIKIINFEEYCLTEGLLAMDKYNLGFGSKEVSMVSSNSGNDDVSYVKIKSGDTLYSIARRHKTTVDRLCRMNGITPKKVLKIGTKLKVG